MRLSRRALLVSLAGAAPAQIRPPIELIRYADPATEFEVVRLTDPAFESRLPASPGRAIDRRSRTLLYASLRSGSWQAWQLELSSGRNRQLGVLERFDPGSLTLSSDDRSALLINGPELVSIGLSSLRVQELYGAGEGCALRGPIACTEDGTSMFFVQTRGSTASLLRLRIPRGGMETVLEQEGAILEPAPNPRRATICWRTPGGELWLGAYDGSGVRRVETPAGRVLQAHWAPGGQSLLYLIEPADTSQLNAIREQGLDSRADSLVALTSQFASFSRNLNATVFVGASRNKASPAVLALLRATRREFTLCEHKAASAREVAPVFSPNSQRVVFQSDRHGKAALYMMNVEKLIEKTDS
ncbi:MAG: PD40 domain-containing protein [Candidatus Solibacter usitatus]|nr:PD40 domain-containing protein [Candidatus Solibacter usitatus]